MTVPPISSVASSHAEAGEYTVLINGGYLTDTGGNSATSFTIIESFGCSLALSSSSLVSTSNADKSASANLGLAKGSIDSLFLSSPNKKTAYYIVTAAAFAFGMVASQIMASFMHKSNVFVHAPPRGIVCEEEYHQTALSAEEFLVPLRTVKDKLSSNAYGSSDNSVGML